VIKLQVFYERLRKWRAAYPSWREGQAVFNALHSLHPELADEIRTTELDPFYQDARLPELYAWIAEELAEEAVALRTTKEAK